MRYLLYLAISIFFPVCAMGQSTWVAPEESKQIKNPFEGNEQAIQGGAVIFDLLCIVCHGETGKGDGVTLEYLNPKPANLTSKQVQRQTAGELYWKITTGRPPMQSYMNVLSNSELWQVVSYIQSLEED